MLKVVEGDNTISTPLYSRSDLPPPLAKQRHIKLLKAKNPPTSKLPGSTDALPTDPTHLQMLNVRSRPKEVPPDVVNSLNHPTWEFENGHLVRRYR